MDTPSTIWTRLGYWIARHPFMALAIVGVFVALLVHAESLFTALFFRGMRLDI